MADASASAFLILGTAVESIQVVESLHQVNLAKSPLADLAYFSLFYSRHPTLRSVKCFRQG